ncbi:MAG: GAF domain-containing protein [Anaerolineae bacterium]|nr:GAF domain-containing protein [Anaerolineae bacterium]
MTALSRLQAMITNLGDPVADTLYLISERLRTIQSEDKLLIALGLPAIERGACKVSLRYIDLDAQSQPEWITIVADWDTRESRAITLGTRFYVPNFPSTQLWLGQPDRPLLVNDVMTDPRLDAPTRQAYAAVDLRATAVVPLHDTVGWVGALTFSWDTPHLFSSDEQSIYVAYNRWFAPVVREQRSAQT